MCCGSGKGYGVGAEGGAACSGGDAHRRRVGARDADAAPLGCHASIPSGYSVMVGVMRHDDGDSSLKSLLDRKVHAKFTNNGALSIFSIHVSRGNAVSLNK